MEEERNYKVYMHTNLINNKKYIGITRLEVEKRFLKGRGYKGNIYFYNAIQKYGWDNFKHEVLLCNLTKEQAEMFEIELIKYYKATNPEFGYNIDAGGSVGSPLSESAKRKISLKNKGRIRTKEEREKHRQIHLGMHHTDEIRRKISNTMKEKRLNVGESNPMFGTRAVNAKKILCTNTNEVFNSIMEASKKLGLDFRLVSAVCRGKRQHTGGFNFKYYEG